MATSAEHKSAASWTVDGAVVVLGLLVGVAAVIGFVLDDDVDGRWAGALLLGVPVIVLMARFPLVLTRPSGGIEVGFDSAVLVFLACFDGGHGALAVWALGQAAAQAAGQKRVDVRLFNVGLGILSGALALATMRAISPLDETSPRELVAVGLGCAVYFLVDYVLSGVSIAVEDASSIWSELREATGLAALGVFVGIDSLGYLAAAVVRGLPGFASLLLAVPLLTILVATRALARGNEHRRRLAALFDAAKALQATQTEQELLDVLRRQARAVVLTGDAEARSRPPEADEIGAQVGFPVGGAELWLVVPVRYRARASTQADRRALEALASVGGEAFARLRLVEQMAQQARHDALTGLPNRVLFRDRVAQAVARSRRAGSRVAVLYLDLDGFKTVNDRFGHAEGDQLLKAVTERLVQCVRVSDSVARLGGDEFAVLVEDVASVREVEQLARRILAALRREIVVAGHEVVVGASIGVALATDEDDGAGLLRSADMAMYRAKALGKNRSFVYEPELRAENMRRLELIEALRGSIGPDLVLHYQPVVELATGRIDGMEALVRWRRDGRLVPPDVFIPAAEESGLIVELGSWVLAQVVRDAPALAAAAGHPLTLGVNMSALQLRDPNFIAQVGRSAQALGDNRLVLEMTETVVVSHDEETAAAVRALKAFGTMLAIDDFGVGFSSIGYLQHLPVDILKADRSFVQDVDSDPRSAALVEAIRVMGTALGLTVVAEGIERSAQADRLRRLGFTVGQGFLYGRPQPLAAAVGLLQAAGSAAALSDASPV